MESRMENKKTWKDFLKEEDGMGTVEIILIIVVLIGLVLIFRDEIEGIVKSVLKKVTTETNKF